MYQRMVEINYKDIKLCAQRITQRNPRRDSEELINETYIWLSDKWTPEDKEEFLKYFVKTMKLLYIGERSPYGKAVRMKETYLEYDPGNSDWKKIEEIYFDEINEQTKETLNNLSHLTQDKAIKYADVMMFKNRLSPHEKELFELHFVEGVSARQIAKDISKDLGYKTSYQNFVRMINEIKKKANGFN